MNYLDCINVTPDPSAIIEKIDWLLEEGLGQYEELSLSEFDISRYPNLPDNMKIEQAFSAGFSDLGKKRKCKKYYVANCVCFLNFARRVVTQDARNLIDEHRGYEQLVSNWKTLLMNLLFDSVLILNKYRLDLKAELPLCPLVRAGHVDALPLWHASRQMLFGQISGLAYVDLEPDLSVAGIRLVIESRIRRGTGVLRKHHKSDCRQIGPVKLSNIIQALEENESQVDLPIPMRNIRRLYKWANEFVHSGTREAIFTWMPMIALDYLKPFALGIQSSSGWSSLNGMRFSHTTLEKVRKRILELEGSDQIWKLVTDDKVEAEIIEEVAK